MKSIFMLTQAIDKLQNMIKQEAKKITTNENNIADHEKAIKDLNKEIKDSTKDLENKIENIQLKEPVNGKDGKDGLNGKDGKDGKNGLDGKNGRDGKDGKDGINGKNGKDGKNGADGKDGKNGKDGIGIRKTQVNDAGDLIILLTDNTMINAGHVKGAGGTNGYNGRDGADGISVTNAEIKNSHLIITLSDGTEIDAGHISGGGGSGVDSYLDLNDKPSLNNVTIEGDMTLHELGIQPEGNYAEESDIPTTLAELSDDTTHRVVTDTEKETWNSKSNFSGSYNDLTNKPDIPSKTSDLTNDSGYITKDTNDLINYTKTSDLSNVATSGNYEDLSNYPSINGVQLLGNKTAEELGIVGNICNLGKFTDYTANKRLDLDTLKPGIYWLYRHQTTDRLYLKATFKGNEIIGQFVTSYNASNKVVLLMIYSNKDDTATSSTIGGITDFYFDDRNQEIKYMTHSIILWSNRVDTGSGQGKSLKPVVLSGAQTITGVKTFSALPKSSVTPTDDEQLVNKYYVDNVVSEKYDKTGGEISGNVKIDGTLTLDIEDEDYDAGITFTKALDTNLGTVLTVTGYANANGSNTNYKPIIRNIGTPSQNYDVANKKYVDDNILHPDIYLCALKNDGTIDTYSSALNYSIVKSELTNRTVDVYLDVIYGTTRFFAKANQDLNTNTGPILFFGNYFDAGDNTQRLIMFALNNNNTLDVYHMFLETQNNKVQSVVANSTSTIDYPSTKAVYDEFQRKPVVVWETDSNFLAAIQADISENPAWQLTGLDLTPYKRVKIYSKAGKGRTTASATPAMVLEMSLDTIAGSTDYAGNFIGSAIVQKPNDNNRLATLTCAISADKTKFVVLRQTSLYGTAATTNADIGADVYKIEGYFD